MIGVARKAVGRGRLALAHTGRWLMVAVALMAAYGYVQHGDQQAQQEAEAFAGATAAPEAVQVGAGQ